MLAPPQLPQTIVAAFLQGVRGVVQAPQGVGHLTAEAAAETASVLVPLFLQGVAVLSGKGLAGGILHPFEVESVLSLPAAAIDAREGVASFLGLEGIESVFLEGGVGGGLGEGIGLGGGGGAGVGSLEVVAGFLAGGLQGGGGGVVEGVVAVGQVEGKGGGSGLLEGIVAAEGVAGFAVLGGGGGGGAQGGSVAVIWGRAELFEGVDVLLGSGPVVVAGEGVAGFLGGVAGLQVLGEGEVAQRVGSGLQEGDSGIQGGGKGVIAGEGVVLLGAGGIAAGDLGEGIGGLAAGGLFQVGVFVVLGFGDGVVLGEEVAGGGGLPGGDGVLVLEVVAIGVGVGFGEGGGGVFVAAGGKVAGEGVGSLLKRGSSFGVLREI